MSTPIAEHMTPYSNLPADRFWRTGVAEVHPSVYTGLYVKKFSIAAGDRIATAGSCFAQHVARHMRMRGYDILDAEPPPLKLDDDVAKKFGYLIYSGRYGNIYTARQLRQLVEDAQSGVVRPETVWRRDGRFFDGLRPNVEPSGLRSEDEVVAHRKAHLAKIDAMLGKIDLLVFTLGLTEAWIDRRSGVVYPLCPGVVAGKFDDELYAFKNFDFVEILEDIEAVRAVLTERNPGFRMLLTVSPVPLTATASGDHVLAATTYSKSVLRAVCGSMAKKFANVDYFPSYELITAPSSRGFFYAPNLREVTEAGVSTVMSMFFGQHGDARSDGASRALPEELSADYGLSGQADAGGEGPGGSHRRAGRKQRRRQSQDAVCEEVLLDAFGKSR